MNDVIPARHPLRAGVRAHGDGPAGDHRAARPPRLRVGGRRHTQRGAAGGGPADE